MLVGLSSHDLELPEGTRKGIDCENDERLLPDSLIGFASKKNYGASATLDSRFQNMVCLTAFDSH